MASTSTEYDVPVGETADSRGSAGHALGSPIVEAVGTVGGITTAMAHLVTGDSRAVVAVPAGMARSFVPRLRGGGFSYECLPAGTSPVVSLDRSVRPCVPQHIFAHP